ncbi:MAG: hypothetical protein INR62_14320, partial [Rhodospirillales bacterium]|nr:hypothetical protein [Acetobacter sp.]
MTRLSANSPGTLLVTICLLGAAFFPSTVVRAADPYDKGLEARVEALERELNAMGNDSKGKN